MKLIAFYLPQFHPIKENDEWWGKGFTEWTNVTKSKPLFEGHYQPHLPSELGFYDLRLPSVMEEQSKLAKKYGIDAFCYYHYWFNEKLLLEKPIEMMLENPNVETSFCLCWANENWSRRWDGKEKEILISQNYETYSAKKHMDWLIPYFNDPRYLKIDGKPIFLVYSAMDIENLKSIIAEWNEYSIGAGFEGIYTVAANTNYNKLTYDELIELGFNAIYNFEPKSFKGSKTLNVGLTKTDVYNYKSFVDTSLNMEYPENLTIFPTVFPNWDNTARRRENAIVIQNEDPNEYSYWLYKSMEKVKNYETEKQIVFINAWNEWAEGAHLEPDMKNGKLYLEATLETKNNFTNGEYLVKDYTGIKNKKELNKSIYLEPETPLYIWGAGKRGIATFDKLPIKTNFVGFIDSNVEKHNSLIEGYSVFNWLLDNRFITSSNPMILIASAYEDEIMELIQQYGFEDGKNYTNKLNVKWTNIEGKRCMEIYDFV
ncbi:glycoside hydrolase family 99-like domain-containing protein [Psychrobacillus sp. NPDC096623]|uniref:glycoside hydrolase family 99-like domain-containing protein n=1 Tax=Psychrobacillus sp. NPDC096623 TaxID=3364492 RepID=UPI0037FB91B3